MDDELDRARPVLEAVAAEAELALIFSLVVTDEEERWLRDRLADALRD